MKTHTTLFDARGKGRHLGKQKRNAEQSASVISTVSGGEAV